MEMEKSISTKRSTHRGPAKAKSLVLIAVAGALAALLLAGISVRRQTQAAAPAAAAPTPSPAGTPDYSKVKDILEGRRQLLRSDDFSVSGVSFDDNQMDFNIGKTGNSQITDVSPNNRLPVRGVPAGAAYQISSTASVTGRMFAFEADSIATVYSQKVTPQSGPTYQNLWVVVYSPSAQSPQYMDTVIEGDGYIGNERTFSVNAVKMADFNQDGFDELVIHYTNPAGNNCISIINAQNVNAFHSGLNYRQLNSKAKRMGAVQELYSAYSTPNYINVDSMTIGDFNGDGQPEIMGVVPGNNGTGLQLAMHTVDRNTLQIADPKYFPLTGIEADGMIVPQAHIAATAGKFTAADHDQLVIAWAVNDQLPVVQFIDFGNRPTFRPIPRGNWHGDTIINTKTEGIYDDHALLRLQSGRLEWSSQFDEVILLYGINRHRASGTSSYDFTMSNLAVSPADNSVAQKSKYETGDQYGTVYDIALGNFDSRSPDPQNPGQTQRNPNLQVGLLSANYAGDIATIDVIDFDLTPPHPAPGRIQPEKISTRSFDQSPRNFFSFLAGDMQGRSMRLGEPTKITIHGAAQPTVVLAAPPMHVDYAAAVSEAQAKVLNVSAIPENFYTSYETEEKSTNQSSSAHTTSWSFGAKETFSYSYEIGSVKAGAGIKLKDTFTAAQALKGSTENSHGTYTSHELDVSQKTNFSDQLWYSESNFNIYIYPVIGQTVCPARKADDDGNCPDSDKVPLTVQFSGPDQITYQTIAANLVEWYQPAWEYGNIFSYPGSYAQLQQIFPDIHKLSTDVNWATDASDYAPKTRWATGTTDSTTTGLSQNYSFDNDVSVSGAVTGVGTDTYSGDLDTSGSYGINDLNKSMTSMGKSTGLGVNKPGSFLDPPNYNYSVTPYIFGRMKPGGSVDNALLTDDVQTFGLLQTAFVVDPMTDTAGGWWRQAYTKTPDIALNHPNRWKFDVDPDSASRQSNCLQLGVGRPSQMNCAEIASASPENPWSSEFHDMRGFFISKADHPGEGSQLSTAKAGDTLRLQARVYNYSLKKMNPGAKVHVRFYGMAWNSPNATPAGDSFLIGEDVIADSDGNGAIPPFDSNPDGAPLNWVLANTNFDTAPYGNKDLVFWVVVWAQEADGSMTAEMQEHGLKSIPTTLKNLVDANNLETEYSNNVGFYKSAFHVLPRSTQLGASNANAAGAVNLSSLKISESRISIGRSVEVSALVRAANAPVPGVSVVFYDGDPQQGGKAFDVERIPYLLANKSYQVRVPFRAKDCGAHRIFITVGAGKPFEVTGSTPVLDVNCSPTPIVPTTRQDCQNDGWRNFGPPAGPFSNQGQCISYVERPR